ncbi:MAG TPA: hypothetical protein PK890_03500 [Terrimesophilobacter sp.]|nr:hypothetical protein [Terrimesophilobacter sp.]
MRSRVVPANQVREWVRVGREGVDDGLLDDERSGFVVYSHA